ncbi:MAG: GtrA family protein [Bacilli bacterium]
MIKLIKEKFLNKKFITFVIIGIINTLNHNIIYLILLNFLPYYWSNVLAFFGSMTISFVLNSWLTFKVKMTLIKFIKFPISYIPNFISQMLGIVILVEYINTPEKYAAFLASLIAIPLTYLIMQFILKD